MGTYVLTTSADGITGTVGADTFQTDASSLNPDDVINGNGGNDTLQLTSAGTYFLSADYSNTGTTNVNGIASVIGSSGDDVLKMYSQSQLSVFTDIDLGGGTNTLQIVAGNINVGAIVLSNIQTLQNLGAGYTFTLKGSQLGAGHITSVKAMSGSASTLRVTDSVLDLTGVTLSNIERLSSTDGVNTTFKSFTSTQVGNTLGVMQVVGGSGNDTINLTVAELALLKVINGGGGTNNLALEAAGSYDLTTLTGGVSNIQSFTGSAGDDTLIVSSNMISSVGTINLGGGTNVLTLASGSTLNISAKTLLNVPTINSSVAGVNFVIAASQLASNGGSLSAIGGVSGGTSNTVTTSGTSLDMSSTALTNIGQLISTSTDGTSFKIGTTGFTPLILTGGSGSDIFHVAVAQMMAASGITVDGGTGVNNVTLDTAGSYDLTALAGFSNIQTVTGSAGGDTLTVNAAMLTGFTSIDLGNGDNTLKTVSTGFDVSAKTLASVQTLADTTAGATFTLSAAQTKAGGGAITSITGIGIGNTVTTAGASLDLSATTLTNIQIITTSNTVGATLIDGNGAHTITGGVGKDTLTGGGGADTLTGGGGADTFKDSAANLNGVTITDLGMDDAIDVTGLALAGATVSLSGSMLKISSNGVQIAQLTVNGTFDSNLVLSTDGAGGTLIKSVVAPVVDVPTQTITTIVADGSGRSLTGTSGADKFIGQTSLFAVDTALETGSKWSQSTVTANSDGTYTVTGANGADQLSNIERVRFDDGVLLFNLPATAKVLEGMYKTTFNRLGDENGLNFHIKALGGADSNAALKTIATAFLKSNEAASLANLSDAQFITTMYQNALNRAPDAVGFQYFLNNITNGDSRADVLLGFATSNEELTLLGQYTKTGIFSSFPDAALG